MTTETFLFLLSITSAITGLITESIKKLANDHIAASYNLIALITAILTGIVSTVCYYQLTNIPYTLNNIILIILMGLASGVTAMVGFDKVKQTIQQIKH